MNLKSCHWSWKVIQFKRQIQFKLSNFGPNFPTSIFPISFRTVSIWSPWRSVRNPLCDKTRMLVIMWAQNFVQMIISVNSFGLHKSPNSRSEVSFILDYSWLLMSLSFWNEVSSISWSICDLGLGWACWCIFWIDRLAWVVMKLRLGKAGKSWSLRSTWSGKWSVWSRSLNARRFKTWWSRITTPTHY